MTFEFDFFSKTCNENENVPLTYLQILWNHMANRIRLLSTDCLEGIELQMKVRNLTLHV